MYLLEQNYFTKIAVWGGDPLRMRVNSCANSLASPPPTPPTRCSVRSPFTRPKGPSVRLRYIVSGRRRGKPVVVYCVSHAQNLRQPASIRDFVARVYVENTSVPPPPGVCLLKAQEKPK